MFHSYFYSPVCYCVVTLLLPFLIPRAAQSQTSGAIPPNLKYRVVENHRLRKIKLSLNIHLNRRLNEDALTSLAHKIYDSYSGKTYDRVFMLYSLPRTIPGHGCWATTHFNPDVEVRIFGLSADEENAILKLKVPFKGKLIGKWIGDGGILFLERSGKGYKLHRYFPDGSSEQFRLRDSKNDGDKQLVDLNDDGSVSQFYYQIRKNGDLALYNKSFFGPNTPSVVYKVLSIPERKKGKMESATGAAIRTWTDISGKFTVTARYVSSNTKTVRLVKTGGKTITVPIVKLSVEDREYVKTQGN